MIKVEKQIQKETEINEELLPNTILDMEQTKSQHSFKVGDIRSDTMLCYYTGRSESPNTLWL